MMLKNEVCLEVKKEEKIYRFSCAPESPLGELFDALSQMRAFVIERMNEQNKPPEKKEE
jgi:hypothetical protein